MRIFNVGWIVFTMMIVILGFTIYGAFNSTAMFAQLKSSSGTFVFLGLGYIGAVIGNAMRLYGMPDMYFTDGTLWGAIKTRFFWSHGPQVIGFFLLYFVIMQIKF